MCRSSISKFVRRAGVLLVAAWIGAAAAGVLAQSGSTPGVPVQTKEGKPRVIVMTDGEIDDQSSMIRFLLYTCDFDTQAIIETNSVYQRSGHSKQDWLEKELDAFEKVRPNLIKHRPDYPTAEQLRKISFVGDEDPEHLMKVTSRAG